MKNTSKIATSFRLSPTGIKLLKELSIKKGISVASTIEIAIREMAERENVTVSEED